MNSESAYSNGISDPRGSKIFGFALFGVGRAGTIHLSYIARHHKINLLYIVDDDKSKWGSTKDKWHLSNTQFITSTQSSQVFKDLNVKAVIVCSPTYTHERIAVEALNNNKAVFCEKPIAENLEKAHAIKKQDLLDNLFSAHSTGGIFHDCPVHDIDMVLYMLGELPTKVSTMAHANLPEVAALGDYDTVAIQMIFASGAVAVIDLSRWCSYGYDQRLEVFGKDGMLKVENRQDLHNVERYSFDGVSTAPIDYSFPSRYKRAYQKEIEHFLAVLEGKENVLVTEKDTLAVSRIASAAEESARTGRMVEIKWAEEKWL